MTTPAMHEPDIHGAMSRRIQTGLTIDEAYTELAEESRRLFGAYPALLATRMEALNNVHTRFQGWYNRVAYIPRDLITLGREYWYLGPDPDARCWNVLVQSLQDLGRTDDEIKLVDEESTVVVNALPNPNHQDFSGRGLVVGHVQSGKTGNMAAVIAKASDTQYKFFLILSGMTDQLRNQTQLRLSRDLVLGRESLWHEWTRPNSIDASGEFREAPLTGFAIDQTNQLAVVKKNKWVLQRFLRKLRQTNAATLENTPFLIIDDECDQASVNSARYDKEVTRTNELIRLILKEIPRVAYVGYTATPFANVLIDPRVPDDLYPRDFIHALPKPDAYFGAEQLFGRQALDGEFGEDSDGYDMIREIPEEDAAGLRPSRGKASSFKATVSGSLDEAVRYFLLVTAARVVRGQAGDHSTMLIHSDVRNSVHEATRGAVEPYLSALTQQVRSEDKFLLAQLRDQWGDESRRVPAELFGLEPVPFERLLPHLAEVAESVSLHVENYQAQERLAYDDGPRRYIVIGGNVLARGLTLHGLSVSYFLRSSSQYDTLMQMGRWFGYRSGFEDLPRVWVEPKVREMFFDLATVEAEIRKEIGRYAREKLKPSDFAVRIRKIPGMLVTSRNKMRHAKEVSVGLSGEHLQTIRFRRNDEDWLERNWRAGASLIDSISSQPLARHGHRCFLEVPVDHILDFLRTYEAHDTTTVLATRLHVKFIETQLAVSDALARWSVVVLGGTGALSRHALGRFGRVHCVKRSAERGSGDASIKALMSRGDLLLDIEGVNASFDATWDDAKALREAMGGGAMLLLYPIEAQSKPGATAKNRVALNAVGDVLGMGIYFPGTKNEVKSYVSADLQPIDAQDEAEEDPIPEDLFETERIEEMDG